MRFYIAGIYVVRYGNYWCWFPATIWRCAVEKKRPAADRGNVLLAGGNCQDVVNVLRTYSPHRAMTHLGLFKQTARPERNTRKPIPLLQCKSPQSDTAPPTFLLPEAPAASSSSISSCGIAILLTICHGEPA